MEKGQIYYNKHFLKNANVFLYYFFAANKRYVVILFFTYFDIKYRTKMTNNF